MTKLNESKATSFYLILSYFILFYFFSFLFFSFHFILFYEVEKEG